MVDTSKTLLIAVILITVSTPTNSQSVSLECPPGAGWSQYGGRCYYVVKETVSWQIARDNCRSNGGKLVEPAPFDINEYIGQRAGITTKYWIGYNRIGLDSNTVTYLDGQWSDLRPEKAYFNHWGHGNPDVDAGNCVFVEQNGAKYEWFYGNCALSLPYVCQVIPCPRDTYRCATVERCIPTSEVCDGVDNCGDGSDESDCTVSSGRCQFVVRDSNIEVGSTNFPANYEDDQTCQWTLIGPLGKRLELQFKSFNTEQDVDVVEIWVGGSTISTSARLAQLSGSNIDTSKTYISSNNLMIIRFTTDDTVSATGFSAKWTTIFSCGMTKLVGMKTDSNIQGQPLTLQSNQNAAYCETQCLALSCVAFTYQQQSHSCQLYDQFPIPEENAAYDLYVKRCPNRIGSEPLNYLPNSQGHYYAVVTDRRLASPMYPMQLPGGLWATYTIEAVSAFSISVELLEADAGPDDYVLILDGDNPSSPELARFTADSKLNTIVSTVPKIFIHIITQTATRGRGFLLSYRQGCEFVISESSGKISSPGYGSRPYPSQTTCSWRITNSVSRPLQLNFLDSFDLETDKDYVQVYIGQDESGVAQHSGLGFTGQTVPPNAIVTPSFGRGELFIKFVTSAIFGATGFTAEFSSACSPIDLSTNIEVSPSTSRTDYGQVFAVRCRTGHIFAREVYRNQNSVTVTCQFGGTWSISPFPQCITVYCGKVPDIVNGYVVSVSGFHAGNNVTYECDPGYNRFGAFTTATCLDTALWTSAPICAASTCPTLLDVINGGYTVTHGGGNRFGTVVEFSCSPGYEVFGLQKLECGLGSSWSGPAPTCERRTCNIPDVKNGRTLPSASAPVAGDMITIECYSGYAVKGANPYECALDDYPTCEDVDECIVGASRCPQICTNTDGSYECSCRPGYRKDPFDQYRCLNINECLHQNGYCNQICADSEGSYSCSCEPGYNMYMYHGHDGITVSGENGRQPWHQYYINHTCIPVSCLRRSATLNNGQALTAQSDSFFGDKIEYVCNMGYRMTAPAVSTCSQTGQWDNAMPNCLPITCPPVTLPTVNAPIPSKTSTVLYLETVQYTCNLPNSRTLVRERHCLYDRGTNDYRLIGDSIECPVIDCGEPMKISGSLPYNNVPTLYPAQFTFNCRTPLWILRGNSDQRDNVIRCGTDGKWDYGNLTCDGPVCTDPGRPPDGEQVATSYEEYSYVSYRCLRAGYEPQPSTPLQCIYDASITPIPLRWTGTPPVCVDVEPPKFQGCPTDVIITRVHQAPNFPAPVATDNSGVVNRITKRPDNFSPLIPVTSEMDVTYIAFDTAGNEAECFIQIKILDEEPPTLVAPNSFSVQITSKDEVLALDPSTLIWLPADDSNDFTLTFEPTLLNLTAMDIGRIFYFTGTVTDAAGNSASSRTQVSVTGTKCQPWALTVRNGRTSCVPKIGGTGYICDITCDAGYGFYEDIELEAVRMDCTGLGDWDRNLPECVALYYPSYRLDFLVSYNKTATPGLNCEPVYEQNLGSSMALLMDVMTRNVCNSVSPAIRVVLRQDGLTVNTTNRNTNQEAIRVMISLEILPKGFDDRPYDTCAQYLFRVFNNEELRYLYPISPLNPTQQNGCPTLRMKYEGTLYNDFECYGHEEFRELNQHARTRCVECPLGYYSLNRRVCIPCEVGTYRDKPGSDYCPACPDDTRSTLMGVRSVDECSRTCPKGMVSVNGLAPCTECPADTYSYNMTYCSHCPAGSFTRGRGKGTIGDCIQQCPPGSYSVDGLGHAGDPCTQCPLNTYHSQFKQTKCLACPDTQMTSSTGAIGSNRCTNAYQFLCLPTPCNNGGTCKVAYFNYYCNCPSGFTGPTCSDLIDPCDSSPCHYSGTCSRTPAGYRCDCPAGTSGDRCENEVDNCPSSQCENKGACQDRLNSYTCLCPSYTGYSGTRCSIARQPCNVDQCHNGAQCKEFGSIRRKCSCSLGYTGDSCQENINECASNPCLHGGTCIDEVNGFSCACQNGYFGTFCQSRDNVCAAALCGTNGKCVDIYPTGEMTCVCNEDFEDVNGVCQVIQQCDSNPCQNGGTCSDYRGGFFCQCTIGFEGSLCQHNIDDCLSNPCKHDGECIDEVNGYSCLCIRDDTGGKNCDDTGDNCKPFPCDLTHGYACTDLYNDFTCACYSGYGGKTCTETVDYCSKSPCEHNGTCVSTFRTYSCSCRTGWTGSNCESLVNNCFQGACLNGGTCINTVMDFQCQCPPGYRGDRCDIIYDLCTVANHCIGPGSTCLAQNSQATCDCAPGHTGEGCLIREVSCSSQTCSNGGTCTETGANIVCSCVPGYTGTHCDENIDECSAANCQGSSVCQDGLNGYTCKCPTGKYGLNCNKDVPYDADLVFTPHIPRNGESVDSGDPKLLNSTGLTVSFWVRYTGNGRSNPGTILALYGLESKDVNSPKTELLRMDGGGGGVSFNGRNQRLSNNPKNISDGLWHHVALTWSGDTGTVRLIVDNSSVDVLSPYSQGWRLPEYGWLVLGGVYDQDTNTLETDGQFEGRLSRVQIILRALTYPTETNKLPEQLLPSDDGVMDYTDAVLTDPDTIKDFNGEVTSNVCQVGQTCPTNTDDENSVKVTSCPQNQVVNSSDRVTLSGWTVPTFNNSISITTSFDTDDQFLWGTHYVTFVAKDENGAAATCTVRYANRRKTCNETQPGSVVGGNTRCRQITGGTICEVECTTYKTDLSQPAPLLYICNEYGMWTAEEQLVPFHFPACAKSEDRKVNALVRISYTFPQDCESVKQAIQNGLRVSFSQVNAQWTSELCNGANCDAIPININCTGSYIEATFNAVKVPLTSTTSTSVLRSPDDILKEEIIDNDRINQQSSTGASPDIRTLEILMVPYCAPGTQLVGDIKCVECGAGTAYDNNTAKCVTCERGFYQAGAAQFSCVRCDDGLTTPSAGAQASSECRASESCQPGEYFDLSSNLCTDCPIGNYQSEVGSFYCIPCPVDKTTFSARSTSVSQCVGGTVPETTFLVTEGPIDPSVGQSLGSSSTLSDGAIAGIVIGILILILLLLLLVCCCRDRILACLPCGGGKVLPQDAEKWQYIHRYGASNDKFVNYRLSEIREKRGMNGGLPQKKWTFHEDKISLMRSVPSEGSDENAPAVAGPLPSAAAAPPVLPPLNIVDETPRKHRKRRKKKHHHREREAEAVRSAAPVPIIAVTEASGQVPKALPPIPSSEIGNPMMTSFAYWRGDTDGSSPHQTRPKTEISNVQYSDFVTERQSSTPRSTISMRDGTKIMVDSDEEDYR